jgi:hypothetical protein
MMLAGASPYQAALDRRVSELEPMRILPSGERYVAKCDWCAYQSSAIPIRAHAAYALRQHATSRAHRAAVSRSMSR